ncbi:MAG TPA: hypothetical protein PLF40_22690 [Kofleriaceae bacterium]|nr:hypothetical protein [Kofleriaceae bacterium]
MASAKKTATAKPPAAKKTVPKPAAAKAATKKPAPKKAAAKAATKKAAPKKATAKAATKKAAPKKAAASTQKPVATMPARVEPPRSGLLGFVTAPSGKLALLDIGLLGYIPLDALAPGVLQFEVPTTPLQIHGEAASPGGGAAPTWQRMRFVVDDASNAIAVSRKIGDVAVDLAQLAALDAAALATWQHDTSHDGLADVVFWGKDATGLAALLAAPSHRDGFGWCDLPIDEAEQRADKIARKKHDHHWQVAFEIRPHSDYFRLAEAARASHSRTGNALLHDGSRGIGWLGLALPTGAFPVFVDEDAAGRLLQIRVEFTADARF